MAILSVVSLGDVSPLPNLHRDRQVCHPLRKHTSGLETRQEEREIWRLIVEKIFQGESVETTNENKGEAPGRKKTARETTRPYKLTF